MRELSMHVLDMLQNAVEAGATQVRLSVVEDLQADRLTIEVGDNGRGMDAETARQAQDPFFTTRTTRHVGLGLPLLAAAAERCEGGLTLKSAVGQGTQVKATFRRSHLDRVPLGNMTDTLVAFLLGAGDGLETRYRHAVGGKAFDLDTAQIRAELEEVPLWHPQVRDWLRAYIAEGEAELVEGEAGGADLDTVGMN